MSDLRQCYTTLGVRPGASADEVKRAYYNLVRKWHPDRVQGDSNRRDAAEEKLKQINVAYDRLQTHAVQDVNPRTTRERRPEAERRPQWSQGPDGYQKNSAYRAYARAAGVSADEPGETAGQRDRAFGLYDEGMARFQSGQWSDAISPLVQSVCLYPNNADAHLTLGLAYRMLKLPAKAVAAFKQASRFNPECESAHVNLGEVCLEIGDYREAIYLASQYLRRRPATASVLVTLGTGYRHMNRLPQALEALQQAAQLEPNLAVAHYELGETYVKSGLLDRARDSYDRLRVLDGDLAVKLLLSIINR